MNTYRRGRLLPLSGIAYAALLVWVMTAAAGRWLAFA